MSHSHFVFSRQLGSGPACPMLVERLQGGSVHSFYALHLSATTRAILAIASSLMIPRHMSRTSRGPITTLFARLCTLCWTQLAQLFQAWVRIITHNHSSKLLHLNVWLTPSKLYGHTCFQGHVEQ